VSVWRYGPSLLILKLLPLLHKVLCCCHYPAVTYSLLPPSYYHYPISFIAPLPIVTVTPSLSSPCITTIVHSGSCTFLGRWGRGTSWCASACARAGITILMLHKQLPSIAPLKLRYITLHYTTLHYTTLHCTTLHYTTLHYTTLHYTALHYTTLHYTTLHYTTLLYTTLLHYTTLHYTASHYISLHYTKCFTLRTIFKLF
jgi:hypothetical protein